MNNIIFDPGVLPEEEVITLIKKSNKNIRIILGGKIAVKKYGKIGIEADYYSSIKTNNNSIKRLEFDCVSIWGKLIDDHQTLMLYDRNNNFPQLNSKKISEIVKISIAYQYYLEEIKPNALVYMATPHNIDTWVFSRVAEIIGIKVYYFQQTILPWRYYLCEGLEAIPSIVSLPKGIVSLSGCEKLKIDRYISLKQGDSALPQYEKDRLIRNKNKYFNLRTELHLWWHRPHLIVNKFFCYKAYLEHTKKFKMPKVFVIFFLHYQPERTTLPEGYGFAQQLLAIYALANALPSNITLLVKEHPSTFTNMCSWRDRYPKFYKDIKMKNNICIVPMDIDAYTLIDKSIVVATITGTIASEAIIRNKPAIVFGNSPAKFIDSKFLHQYKTCFLLKKFINEIIENQPKVVVKIDLYSEFNV